MSSDQLEKVKVLIAEAAAGDPDSFTLELSHDTFEEIGAALDGATELVESRGYNLTRVRAEDRGWVASYQRPLS